ncbi:MAG: response regulator transcription factor [Clostridiales bacterium]|nr:response regulator transcription factor [Clostridiales bacterium]
MGEKYRILIVEDDEDISMIEQVYLENSGYETQIVRNGKDVAGTMESDSFDLVLLDLMLPGKNGYEVCKEIREKYLIPILMVTAKTDAVDKIRGLNIGADDYITKPFDPAELVARVGANIRQYYRNRSSEDEAAQDEIHIGDICIQRKSRKVYRGDTELRLPNKEFELLLFLAENANIVFSRDQLFEKIWGYDYAGDTATVMVHINRIQEKIEKDCKNPQIIETVWGAGYRLNK